MSQPLKTPALDALLADVERLKEAERLLEAVFQESGPYQREPVSTATWMKVQQFFGFDDSV